jgi:type I restriction enzyme S subunit
MSLPNLRFKKFSGKYNSLLLGDIASFYKGKGISKADISDNGDTPCIRYGELYTKYSVVITNIHSRTNLSPKNLFLSNANDVIIPASGETQADIATASCVTIPNVALGGDLNIIRSDQNGVYLSYYLNSQKKFEIAKLAQGNSVVHLYSSQLKTLRLNLPTFEEQEKVASFLSAIDKKISILTQKHELLISYKKGVMQKIFSQEIRFKDDTGNNYQDWDAVTLQEICSIKKGNQLNKESMIEGAEFPVLNGGISFSGFTSEWNTEANSIAISEGGNSCGYVSMMTQRFWSGGHCYTLQNLNISIETQYLFQFLKCHQDELMRLRVGSGLPNIQKKSLSEFNVQRPSIQEQTKIANFLSALDQKISNVQKQLELTQQYKQGLLQQMFV